MPLGSVALAFLIGAIIVAVTGANPLDAYSGLLCGGFGIACTQNENPALQLSNTIVFLIPLITTGVAVALPFRAGLFNIGAEGQLTMASLAAAYLGFAACWLCLVVEVSGRLHRRAATRAGLATGIEAATGAVLILVAAHLATR